MEMMSWAGNNWHKVLIVVLAAAQAWKYFFEYIRPAVEKEKPQQHVVIQLPEKGCTITVKPLE